MKLLDEALGEAFCSFYNFSLQNRPERYPTKEHRAVFLCPSLMIAQCLLLSVQPILQITEFAACYIYLAVIKII